MVHAVLRLPSKENKRFFKFYVVEHSTAILGVSDSEKLGLVKVNFDMIQNKNAKTSAQCECLNLSFLKLKWSQSIQNYSKELAAWMARLA